MMIQHLISYNERVLAGSAIGVGVAAFVITCYAINRFCLNRLSSLNWSIMGRGVVYIQRSVVDISSVSSVSSAEDPEAKSQENMNSVVLSPNTQSNPHSMI